MELQLKLLDYKKDIKYVNETLISEDELFVMTPQKLWYLYEKMIKKMADMKNGKQLPENDLK